MSRIDRSIYSEEEKHVIEGERLSLICCRVVQPPFLHTDEVEKVGLTIDCKNGRPGRMYGVGGERELCFEQTLTQLEIDNIHLDCFQIQLGITKGTYGFNGMLGVDFMIRLGLIIYFNKKEAFRK